MGESGSLVQSAGSAAFQSPEGGATEKECDERERERPKYRERRRQEGTRRRKKSGSRGERKSLNWRGDFLQKEGKLDKWWAHLKWGD